MVGHHVAHGARTLVKRSARFHAHGLCHGDLHVVNVFAAPQRLENTVGKAHEHDVLHRLFAQKVVHAVNLRL